ncbi:zinc finger protein 133 [Aplysia californica]|uniref:Zinc finger protein 133 n=1 Tax=Aplysia californica TaxID=6500 RepID=A0ABM1W3J1_APLCA|nr:zinc finger protein 133 [Aplysia californica]
MTSPKEDMAMDTSDLTSSELALVSAHEKAGLVSQLACHFCGLQFDVKKTRTLRAHIEEVHVLGDAGYMCGICCEEFTSRKAVENHMSTFHRAPKPLGCGTCGETFRVRNLLLKHIDSHTKGEIDNNKVGLCYCGECFEFFDSVMSLQIHSMTHREQPIFVCGACGLQTQHRHVMIKHLETHVISNLLTASEKEHSIHELRPTEIDAALIEVSSPSKIQNGEPAQIVNEGEAVKGEEETSYKCGVCYASFVNLNDALGHAETHQEDEESQMVKELDFKGTVELNVLMPESAESSEDVQTENQVEAEIHEQV